MSFLLVSQELCSISVANLPVLRSRRECFDRVVSLEPRLPPRFRTAITLAFNQAIARQKAKPPTPRIDENPQQTRLASDPSPERMADQPSSHQSTNEFLMRSLPVS